MITWGISANSHDAALAVFKGEKLVFASHSERFSGIKNDPDLHPLLVRHAKKIYGDPDCVVWYERPFLKTLRQAWAGQGWLANENDISQYLKRYNINAPIVTQSHHRSHAAAGYFTSGFDEACIVVIDAIGEFETLTIWKATGTKLKKVYRQSYPHSLGLWYSAMTQRCGLKPNEEEYILMGMAALGDPHKFKQLVLNHFFDNESKLVSLNYNLHQGCRNWMPDLCRQQDLYDLAAATQWVYEHVFVNILETAKKITGSKNLVLMGGCALNCVANRLTYRYFDNVWIMPNPGDAGSSVGAVLSYWNKHIKWPGALLGYDMGHSASNSEIIDYLLEHKICGLARGPAEFGPRALGNRSLVADPRGADIKDRVNEIKKRQEFRPFAPAILFELASDYFDIPRGRDCSYMQMIYRCKYPDLYPAITHVDGTSRVQTVPNDGSPFRQLLELWYERTGCPMLLNTSLNVKGQPMVNNLNDARRWSATYGLPVFT